MHNVLGFLGALILGLFCGINNIPITPLNIVMVCIIVSFFVISKRMAVRNAKK